jgi:hypothetical protein
MLKNKRLWILLLILPLSSIIVLACSDKATKSDESSSPAYYERRNGDVNLNGTPHEINDAIIFANYLVYGTSAFTIDFESQKAETELNGDGKPLTIADFVYLIRLLTGDAPPLPIDTVLEALSFTDGDITINSPVGAAYLIIDGNANVYLTEGTTGMNLLTNFRDGRTYALLYSLDRNITASGYILKTSGELISADAVTYSGDLFKKVEIIRNNLIVDNSPNPFTDSTTFEIVLPSASNWKITIYYYTGEKKAELYGYAAAGFVEVVWVASGFSLGSYFYTAETNTGFAVKGMTHFE